MSYTTKNLYIYRLYLPVHNIVIIACARIAHSHCSSLAAVSGIVVVGFSAVFFNVYYTILYKVKHFFLVRFAYPCTCDEKDKN